jgi:hypothetical protein
MKTTAIFAPRFGGIPEIRVALLRAADRFKGSFESSQLAHRAEAAGALNAHLEDAVTDPAFLTYLRDCKSLNPVPIDTFLRGNPVDLSLTEAFDPRSSKNTGTVSDWMAPEFARRVKDAVLKAPQCEPQMDQMVALLEGNFLPSIAPSKGY